MLFVKADELKTGMRLAKPIYNKIGVMLYERNSKLTSQGIISIQNFGLIGVYILEPAEPVPPMSEDDIEFERFQAMAIFTIKDILDQVKQGQEPKGLYPFANQILKQYGSLYHKINFVQNLRSADDYTYKHSLNTAILCALMSKKMKFEFKKQLDVVIAGIVHDMGGLMYTSEMRKKPVAEYTPEDEQEIKGFHKTGYQVLGNNNYLDTNAKVVAQMALAELHGLKTDFHVDKRLEELEVLKIASVFDAETAMKYGEPPLSEIIALRHLKDPANGYDQTVVQALVDSINILQPGVCVELNNGDKGLVITEGATDVLHPFVLSFRDNHIINLDETGLPDDYQIKDIMKTMDNRHVINRDLLEAYRGNIRHMGK